jgi:hypothetical protein
MVCVGDDWAGDHHDVELVDAEGRRLARARLPEGLDGVARLHALIAGHMPPAWAGLDPGEAAGRVRIGIESDRGPWVAALVAAGYQVYPINPMSVARYPRAALHLGGEVRRRRRVRVGRSRAPGPRPAPPGGR